MPYDRPDCLIAASAAHLPAVVGQECAPLGVGDAHVDKPADPGFPRRVNQSFEIVNSSVVGDAAARIADPVGVVDGFRTAERFDQICMIEAQFLDSDASAERIGTVQSAGQCLDPFAHFEELRGDAPPGKAESAGYGVHRR